MSFPKKPDADYLPATAVRQMPRFLTSSYFYYITKLALLVFACAKMLIFSSDSHLKKSPGRIVRPQG